MNSYKPTGTLVKTGFSMVSMPEGIRPVFYSWALEATRHIPELQNPYPEEKDLRIHPDILLRRVLHWYFYKSDSAYRYKNIDGFPPIPDFNSSIPIEGIDGLLFWCLNKMVEAGELTSIEN